MHYGRARINGSITDTQRMLARKAKTIDGMRKCFRCGEIKPHTKEFFGLRKGKLKGTCRKCMRRASDAWALRKYGLDFAAFDAALEKQQNKCAICAEPLTIAEKKVYWPHIDHDHKTGKFRGLLCHHCNVLLGHAKDNEDLLMQAIKYLGEHR